MNAIQTHALTRRFQEKIAVDALELTIPEGELFALEVNTLPGMTDASLVPKEAAAEGMEFGELLEMLLSYAMDKKA